MQALSGNIRPCEALPARGFLVFLYEYVLTDESK